VLYEEGRDDVFYYITLNNDNYPMPPMPEGSEEGILEGLHKVRPAPDATGKKKRPRAHLLGSGPILLQALRAQELLDEHFGVAADVWSATSYGQLRRGALEAERWNLLHPAEPPRKSYLERTLGGEKDAAFVAASDYVRAVPEMIARWVPGGLLPLGTDGFGRSDSRPALRRFFEVDAECIALAALYQLSRRGAVRPEVVQQAIGKLGIDPDKLDPMKS
jgi:pyruvate dehydrogenase E1 component